MNEYRKVRGAYEVTKWAKLCLDSKWRTCMGEISMLKNAPGRPSRSWVNCAPSSFLPKTPVARSRSYEVALNWCVEYCRYEDQ